MARKAWECLAARCVDECERNQPVRVSADPREGCGAAAPLGDAVQ